MAQVFLSRQRDNKKINDKAKAAKQLKKRVG